MYYFCDIAYISNILVDRMNNSNTNLDASCSDTIGKSDFTTDGQLRKQKN
jgi:hypothetical protein